MTLQKQSESYYYADVILKNPVSNILTINYFILCTLSCFSWNLTLLNSTIIDIIFT